MNESNEDSSSRNGTKEQQCTCPDCNKNGSEWTRVLLLTTIFGVLGCALPFGYNLAVINSPHKIIQDFMNETIQLNYGVTLSEDSIRVLWSVFVSIFLIGGMFGAMLGGPLSNQFGRKKIICGLLILNVAGCLCLLICTAASSTELLFLGRFIGGIASGLFIAVQPMYITELGSLRLRGNLGVTCNIGISIGIILAQILALKYVLGNVNHWSTLLGIYGFFSLISLPYIVLVSPESPRYLCVILNESKLAIEALKKVRRCKSGCCITKEVEEMEREAMQHQDNRNWSYFGLFQDPVLRRFTLLVCLVMLTQQITGINAVFFYSSIIFMDANFNEFQSEMAILGTGLVSMASSITTMNIIHRFPRRKLLTFSYLGIIVCMTSLSVSLLSKHISGMIYVSIASIYLYIITFGVGLAPMGNFIASGLKNRKFAYMLLQRMLAELIPDGPRSRATSLGSLCQWIGNISVGLIFPSVQYYIGAYSLLIFSVVALTAMIIIYFCLPETFNRQPSDIYKSFSK